jgi:cytidine deaminase
LEGEADLTTRLGRRSFGGPHGEPTAPCGACRQVINEFGPDAEIISVCEGPAIVINRLAELLPGAFGPANLKR